MTIQELHRKVAILEQAQLQTRFQVERLLATGGDGPIATFSPKEFAKRIGRSHRWVCQQIKRGGITAFGPPYIIPGSELTRFV